MFESENSRAATEKTDATSYCARMAPLPTQVVANELRARIPDLDALRLHKLLYYCQGHHLAAFGTRLFGDPISAYDNGPVVARLRWAEKHGEPPPYGSRKMSEAELNTVGFVISRYGNLTGPELIEKTHNETPWKQADEGREPGGSRRIEESWMQIYFRESAIREDPSSYNNSPLAQRLLKAPPDTEYDVSSRDDPSKLRDKLNRLRRLTG